MKAFPLSDVLFIPGTAVLLVALNEFGTGLSYPLVFPLILTGYFVGKLRGKRLRP